MNLSDYIVQTDIRYQDHLLIPETKSLGYSLKRVSKVIDYDVAIIGVNSDVNAIQNRGTATAPDQIRKHLYALKGHFSNFYLSDLGNIIATKSHKNTYLALEQVVEHLVNNRVIPIIIGGSHDIGTAVYNGLIKAKRRVNVSVVDVNCDASDDADFHNHNFLGSLADSDALESFSLLGYQNYSTDESVLTRKLSVPFEKIRLGNVRKYLSETEVSMRDSDLALIDIGSVRRGDAPGCAHGLPNGLYAEEICQLSRYAGFSDRISAFGLFEVNPTLDMHDQTSSLAAQVIWHFLDGLNNRQKDYPLRDIGSYNNYIVHQPDINQNIKFYNNPANNRWWMEIPGPIPKIISCSPRDYQDAGQNKIPDRYMRWIH